MIGALALFRLPSVRVALAAALIVLAGALGGWLGRWTGRAEGVRAERGRWEARIAADAAKARQIETREAAIGRVVGAQVDAAREVIRWRTRTLTERIPYAVPTDPDRAFLPWGLVRLHDEAAVGVPGLADAPVGPDAQPSPFADPDIAAAVVINYGACHADREALKGWQDWWAGLAAAQGGGG